MGLESKHAELKALDETGKGSALFALWDTCDLDGDITRKGYFGNQQEVFLIPHHLMSSGQPPLGKGVVLEKSEGAVFEFEMEDHDLARAWLSHFRFDLAKGQAPRQVWSYGFRVLDGGATPLPGRKGRELHARPDGPGCLVIEVSPVTAAAQPLSRTLDAKQDGAPLSPRQQAWATQMYQRHRQREAVLQEIREIEASIGQEEAHILYRAFLERSRHVVEG